MDDAIHTEKKAERSARNALATAAALVGITQATSTPPKRYGAMGETLVRQPSLQHQATRCKKRMRKMVQASRRINRRRGCVKR